MDSSVIFLSAITSALAAYLYLQIRSKRKLNLPPQPTGNYLISGYARRLSNKQYLDFERLAKEFGDIFCFRLYNQKVYVLNTYEAIKEAFVENGDWLSGRSRRRYDADMSGGFGLVSSQGDLWREHRRFSLAVLRDFGLGKSVTERIVQDELEYLRSEIDAQAGRAFDPKKTTVKAVSNVICALVFSERCGEDPEFEELIEGMTVLIAKGPRSRAFFQLWPLFKYLPGDFSGMKRLIGVRDRVYAYIGQRFKKHMETFDPDNIRDFIDAFLSEMAKSGSDSRWFIRPQLFHAVFDLFLAGAETTSTTILWGLSLLARHPDIQRQAQAEIDRVIGDSKIPETADRLKLRYVEAVICEIQRFATIVPASIPHTATQTRKFRDYDIEEGSFVIANVWNVHRNAPCWVDPYSFNPRNFLDADGNFINLTYLIPFGVGKRSCLGESLARQELFVFITGLLQRYDVKPDPTSALPEIEDSEGNSLVRAPRPFRIVMTPRNTNN